MRLICKDGAIISVGELIDSSHLLLGFEKEGTETTFEVPCTYGQKPPHAHCAEPWLEVSDFTSPDGIERKGFGYAVLLHAEEKL